MSPNFCSAVRAPAAEVRGGISPSSSCSFIFSHTFVFDGPLGVFFWVSSQVMIAMGAPKTGGRVWHTWHFAFNASRTAQGKPVSTAVGSSPHPAAPSKDAANVHQRSRLPTSICVTPSLRIIDGNPEITSELAVTDPET